MKLRAYEKEDAAVICSWIRTEEELYRWSADIFCRFPMTADVMEENYSPQIAHGRFFPLTAVDDEGNIVGHFIIRYPREDDDSTVRFGFVILDPKVRGKGYGQEMLRLGIRYVKDNLKVSRIDLGVFENNEKAKRCYEAVGFREYSRRDCKMPIGTWICIDMELMQDDPVEYRYTTTDDIEDLMRIRLEMLRVVNDLDEDYVYDDDFIKSSRDYFLNGDQITVFASCDNKIIGCASICFMVIMPTFDHPAGKRAHLMNVYTNAAFRRKGIGYKMTLMLIDEAWKRGATEISLDATESGRPLYRKCGFSDSDECMVLVRRLPGDNNG
ncbi:MAG: N-acetyltransferase [Lachnospiraceae bacterium]|nr:N-acetyltransferase [Lachnospiraceae bacterium]